MFCPTCGASHPQGAMLCAHCGSLLPTGPALPTLAYAGLWRRLLAGLIDGLVLFVVSRAVSMFLFFALVLLASAMSALGAGAWVESAQDRLFAPVYLSLALSTPLVSAWLYYALLESSSRQATPGKMALGIAVTGLGGERLSFARAGARFWAKAVSVLTLGIGFLIAGFTAKKQALHDILAGSLLVRT